MRAAVPFAHGDGRKAEGLAAIKSEGSLRKAAALTGIPRSSLHRWARSADPAAIGEAGDTDAADTVTSVTIDGEPIEVGPLPVEPDPVAGPTTQVDLLWMRAFHRYASLLANGVPQVYALQAANRVHPGFDLDHEDHAEIQQRVKAMTFSELVFAADTVNPPKYLEDILSRYSWDDGAVSTLADTLYAAKLDAYAAGINDQLIAIGRDPIKTITDPNVLTAVRQDANDTARQVGETWNRDAASQASRSFLLDVSDAARMKGDLLHTTAERQDELDQTMSDWYDSRMDWKPMQWALTEIGVSANQAGEDFARQNGGIEYESIQPGSAECIICLDLIGEGAKEAGYFDGTVPAHPGCAHFVERAYNPDAMSGTIWTGQYTGTAQEEIA